MIKLLFTRRSNMIDCWGMIAAGMFFADWLHGEPTARWWFAPLVIIIASLISVWGEERLAKA